MSISIFCKVTNFTIIFTIPLTICFIIGYPIIPSPPMKVYQK